MVPEDLKDTLKGYIGRLVDEHRLLTVLQQEHLVVSVGDKVTYTLLTHGVTPVVSIVDYILERKPYPQDMKQTIQGYPCQRIQVNNPPGTISDELWQTLQTVFHNLQNGPFCIEVNGEEDLASLAAIALAPRGVTVIYGLPNKGVVVVKATPAHKKKVFEVLQKM